VLPSAVGARCHPPASSPMVRMKDSYRVVCLDVEHLGRLSDDDGMVVGALDGPKALSESSPYGRCYVVGTWDAFSTMHEMTWDESAYRCCVELSGARESFHILCECSWKRRIYPSMPDANPHVLHVLCGPDANKHNMNWTLCSDRCGDRMEETLYEIVMVCPKGCAISVGWRVLSGGASPRAEDAAEFEKLGQWNPLDVLGQGRQGAVVYMAQWPGMDVNGLAAVKYPVPFQELHTYSLVNDLAGVPDLLDFGVVNGSIFMAMPALAPALEDMLCRFDIDGLGGRVPWSVVQGLARAMIAALRQIHGKGIIHCDIKPKNVLVPAEDPQLAYIIDFGRSLVAGAAHCRAGHGGMRDYMSIRAGLKGGERLPADDLESVGWVLLRCVLGGLPWKAKLASGQVEAWHEGSRSVCEAKARFLDAGSGCFGPRWDYCPPQLDTYLRRARGLSDSEGREEVNYEDLASLFCSGEGEELTCWGRLAAGNGRLFTAVRGFIMWRPRTSSASMGTRRRTTSVVGGVRIWTTGRTERCGAGGLWLETDPVWTPGLPRCLLEQSWLLQESPAQGLLLEPVALPPPRCEV